MTTAAQAVASSSSSPIPSTMPKKFGGYEFYRSIGSPRYVVAPMVDQSELAWRLLSKSPLPPALAGPSETITSSTGKTYTRYPGGAHLTYTPMIHARLFAESKNSHRGGDSQFDLTNGEEGSEDVLAGVEGGDRPLFVQFCANDAETLLAAAKKVEGKCDAVDINFGCPQGIARRGNYGAFLQDDWTLIQSLISTLHQNLAVPVTAKFRIFPDLERTLAYAKMMEAAGAQILTCHGRTREMKGQMTGLADWQIIKAVKQAVNIPVFANGNILYYEDVERCLELTGCDGVMTAEGNLSNPAIFLPPSHPHFHPSAILLATRYLDIVESLKTPTGNSAIKAHLFRIFKPLLDQHEDLRIVISRCGFGVEKFRDAIRQIQERVKEGMAKEEKMEIPPLNPETGYRELPIWRAQPYIRAHPVSTEIGGKEDAVTEELTGHTVLPGKCVLSPCAADAAVRCPTKACMVHCRQMRAVEAGWTEEEARLEVMKGGLVGMGCEAHEEKARKRKERENERRESKKEGKKFKKLKKEPRKVGAGGM